MLCQMARQPDASLSLDRLLYIAPSSIKLVLHLGIEKYHPPWRRASESASQLALRTYRPGRQCAEMITSVSPIKKTVSHSSSMVSKRRVHVHAGDLNSRPSG